ncbi:hypothetical protein N9I97_01230 [bacterium]|jgi:hypothetical protein|nr:hypothetical protein [bacterium]
MYSASSPYYKTPFVSGRYLDILKIRPIPAEPDDVLYVIQVQYTHRPDLLAFDMYGDKDLWWVYAQRNIEILKDPVFDFEAGTEIFVPKGPSLKRLLGL